MKSHHFWPPPGKLFMVSLHVKKSPNATPLEKILPTTMCIVLTASVVRWLWPTSAEWCHENLLDSTKNLVTNFQLKSAKSSEILLKNLLVLRW